MGKNFKARERISREQAAYRILTVLAERPEREMKKDYLMRRTALRPSQFYNGAAWIKVHLATKLEERAGWVYVVTYSGFYSLTQHTDRMDLSKIERQKDASARMESLHAYLEQMEKRCEDKEERRRLRAARKLVGAAASVLSDE